MTPTNLLSVNFFSKHIDYLGTQKYFFDLFYSFLGHCELYVARELRHQSTIVVKQCWRRPTKLCSTYTIPL